MPATVDLNRVEHMARVLLEKFCDFLVTTIQKRHHGSGDACWRLCGANGANHFHIFWSCRVLRTYWEGIHEHIQNIFGVNIPFKCETMYFGDTLFDNWNINDQKILGILLAASKKSITRKWLKVDPPTINEWIDIVHEIYIMEKLSFSLRVQKAKFYRIWTKWAEYVKPVR